MGLKLNYDEGQTALDEDEKDGLLIQTITTRAELDEYEQLNIEEALQWLFGRNLDAKNILTESFIRKLHKRMFGNVWSWAGKFRKTEKNIGVEKWKISTHLRTLCDDTSYWIQESTYPMDEIALRFKHRIVCIHCFPNGNGRHSRLMSDVIIEKIFQEEFFTWGAKQSVEGGKVRVDYLKAVRLADRGDLNGLLEFARS